MIALSNDLRKLLLLAIKDYDFPCVTYDFSENKEIRHPSMREVEATIKEQLLADKVGSIRDGFSNVLYWGYARTGYRRARIENFRTEATEAKLWLAKETLQELRGVGVRKIVKIRLPQFSGLSFVSKVRMFLDPTNYVVLDIQLLKLRGEQQPNIFQKIVYEKGKSIRVTKGNEAIYEQWCDFCRRVAEEEFSGLNIRAVDIERGIFYLTQTNRMPIAVQIIADT